MLVVVVVVLKVIAGFWCMCSLVVAVVVAMVSAVVMVRVEMVVEATAAAQESHEQ